MTIEEENERLKDTNKLYRRLIAQENEMKKPSRFECFTLGFTLAMLIAQIAIFVVQLKVK